MEVVHLHHRVQQYYFQLFTLHKYAYRDKGIKETSHDANFECHYIAESLKEHYNIPRVNENGYVSHELIIDTKNMENGITDKDIAKRLMDYGFHAPYRYQLVIV